MKMDDRAVRLERAYTRCRYGQLHYLIGRPEVDSGAPPLVLLHQNPSSSVEYTHFAAEMAKDRLVIAFDTPGNGMSDQPPAPLSMAEYAAAFADGLETSGLTGDAKVDVFGYHTGTYLAAELALASPQKVGRLILSGLPFRPADQRATRLEAARLPMPLGEDGESLFAFLHTMWAYVVTDRDPAVPLEWAVQMFAENTKSMQRHAWPYVGVWSYDAEDRLPRLSQPVLVLQPHEPLLEHSRAAAALIRNVRFVELPKLNRDIFWVGVSELAAAIRDWRTTQEILR